MSDWDMLDLDGLAESCDLECKAAQGRDGRGELPEDFWKSYSAMANADGGLILLGVQEKPRGQFRALGLVDVERVRKALWDNLNNRKQISANLLSVLPWQDRRAVSLFEDGGTSALTPELSTLTPELSALTPELSALTPELESLSAAAAIQVVSNLDQLSEAEIGLLRQQSAPVSGKSRASPELVRQTVLTLCAGRYLGLRVLADLLKRRDRDGKDLRTRILNPLVAEGSLLRAYPKANDPRQAYITNTPKGQQR